MKKKIIPSDKVCIDFEILFLIVMYFIADIQLQTLSEFISKNDFIIKQSKTNLQLPQYAPTYIQRTGNKVRLGSQFREISSESCPSDRVLGSCLSVRVLESGLRVQGLWSYLCVLGFGFRCPIFPVCHLKQIN